MAGRLTEARLEACHRPERRDDLAEADAGCDLDGRRGARVERGEGGGMDRRMLADLQRCEMETESAAMSWNRSQFRVSVAKVWTTGIEESV